MPYESPPKHYHSYWVTVDSGKRLAVHFPCQHDLMNTSFPVENRENIVVHLTLLGVCICSLELYIGSTVFETAAVFEYLFSD